MAVLDVHRHLMFSLPPPNRHHHVLRGMMAMEGVISGQEGFITDEGRFVDREVALVYALSNKQIRTRPDASPTDYCGNELFSEDLW